ncbi:CBS domain-containing protein [Thalassiella azotivora]
MVTAAALQSQVRQVMSRPVAGVDVTASMREIADLLTSNEISAVAVLAGGRFVGVVTERDVTTQVSVCTDPDLVRADEMVTYAPVTVAATDTLSDAAHAMLDAGVRHLPVVEGDEVVGVLSLRDVARLLLAGQEAEATVG